MIRSAIALVARSNPDSASLAMSVVQCVAGYLLLLLALPLAASEGWQTGGHLKYQYSHTSYGQDDLFAIYGDTPARDQDFDLRLKAALREGAWDITAHYELLALAGDSLAARRRLAALGYIVADTADGLPDDRARLFDLTGSISDGERHAAVQRLDRLALGFARGDMTLRFGRQAVSWGNGLAFQVLDFVNPFAPLAVDKEYKTGEDMLYGQWSLGSGDVQAMLLPRRDLASGELDSAQGSAAAKLRVQRGGFDVDLLMARHYDKTLLGAGIVRSLGGAVWRLDVLRADRDRGGVWSWLSNVDYSWTWSGKNLYGYAEIFRNGFGETELATYAAPNPALAAHIARGELYTLARDYLALGLQIELAPLFNLHGGLVRNLNDGSGIWQLRAVYDWQQNVQLMAGINLPTGARGDEYGGIATPGGYLAGGRVLFARAAYYF